MKEQIKYGLLKTFVVLIYVISHIYDYLSYPIYALYYHPWRVRRYRRNVHSTVEKRDDCVIYEGVTKTLNPDYKDLCKVKVDTFFGAFEYSVAKFGTRACLGTREVFSEEEEVQPNGKVFKKYVMGAYKFMNYDELKETSYNLAEGFRSLNLPTKSRIAMFAETRKEWILTAYAAFINNFAMVTLYTNLGDDGIVHGINETEVSLVVCTDETLPKIKRVLKSCPKVKTVIVMEALTQKKSDLSYDGDVEFIMFHDLMTRKSKEDRYPGPTPNDTAIIMYTSGSTGTPKGVIISHKNIISGVKSLMNVVTFKPSDRYIGYLPLAHVLELIAEMVCLCCGVKIGYSSPLTLTNKSSKIKIGCKGDANVFKPTLMCSVPIVLERIYKSIVDTMRRQGWAIEELFHYFVSYKMKWNDRGFDTPLLNKTLFRKVRYFIGGRVRLLLSGGAPISHDTQSIARTALSVPLIQGYGLTELTGGATMSDQYDRTTCRVGPPLMGIKLKLVNWEEGNYRIDDQPFPRGEIHCGGDSICQGYFKNAEKTAEDFYEEDGIRWFKTGDIGQMEADGVLRIIDRKKDLVKLSGGEYISYGKVESILKTCPIVENICTYADPLKDYLFAIVIPDKIQLKDRNLTPEGVCKDPAIIKALTKEIGDYGSKNGLVKFEVPGKILFVSDEWTTDNGLITAAFKIRRKQVYEMYKDQILELYK